MYLLLYLDSSDREASTGGADASCQNRPRHQLHRILQELRLPCTCKSRGFVTPASQLHPNRFQFHVMQEFAVVLNIFWQIVIAISCT